MAMIEVAAVTAVEQMHPGGEIGLGRFQKKVFVIGQLHESVQPPAVSLHGALQPVEAALAIGVIPNDRAALVAARHDVIDAPGQLDAQWACHDLFSL